MRIDRRRLRQILNCIMDNVSTCPAGVSAAEFSAIFEGTDFDVLIGRWESVYVGERNVLLNVTTLSVLKEYARFGLKPAVPGMPGDDILPETEFLLYLLADAQRDSCAEHFLKKHYIPFVKGMFGGIAEKFQEGYYGDLSRQILREVQEWEDALEQILDRENDADEIVRPEVKTERDSFRFLREMTAEEAKTFLEEKVVNTCGRGNCGGKCVIRAHVQGGCITSLESDIEADDETIYACARGRGYRRTFLNSGRIRYPMVRCGKRGEGRFRRISWEEALTLMEQKIREITEKYGPGARYVNYATGVASTVRGDALSRRLFGLTGGFLDGYNTYSNACGEVTLPYIYGTVNTGSSYDTYRDSELVILWGYNPIVTNFSPAVRRTLKYLKEKGVPIIVIDPQFSDTAAVFGSKWIPVRPGTDAALATAMAYVLWEEGLCDRAFMDRYCVGFDEAHMPVGRETEENYREYLYGIRDGIVKTPEWAAGITGVPAEQIYDLARLLGRTKPAAILCGDGIQRCSNGEQQIRCINALACMTGNIGIRGGAVPGKGYMEQKMRPHLPVCPNPYGKSIPTFLWTDAVLRGKEMTVKGDHIRGGEILDSDIKLIFNLAGNTLTNQHSDIRRTEKILGDENKCEFIVVSDLFYHSTARYADLLLPGASLFETESLSAPWGEGNYLLYGNQVIDPVFESRFEFDWLRELAERLGAENFSEGCATVREWNRLLYERVREQNNELPDFDTFAANGGYKFKTKFERIAFWEQIDDPERHPFGTPSGKIEIYSGALADYREKDIPPLPKYMPGFEGIGDKRLERYPLQLIGWHTKRRCHSIHDQNEWMEQAEPHRLWMHPEDAGKRGISEESEVLVYNDRGTVKVKVHLSNRIMPGVVCMPQGAWYTTDKNGVDVRGSVNTLTTSRPTPLAKGNPQHSTLVEVALAANAG